MLDNAIQVFYMDEQRKLDPGKHVEEQLASVRSDIETRRHYIQPAAQGEVDFYQGYMRHPFALRPSNEKLLYRITEDCIGCGICSRVCPMGCIRIEGGRPVYDYACCANCFGCIQACPKKALRFVDFDEPNPSARYRKDAREPRRPGARQQPAITLTKEDGSLLPCGQGVNPLSKSIVPLMPALPRDWLACRCPKMTRRHAGRFGRVWYDTGPCARAKRGGAPCSPIPWTSRSAAAGS